MTRVEVGYVVISTKLKKQECKKEQLNYNIKGENVKDALLVKSLNPEAFSTALREYVTQHLQSSGVLNGNSSDATISFCNYSPSVHFSLEKIESPRSMCNNLEECTWYKSNATADAKNGMSTVITFCLMPHVLDDAGEFCESTALEQIEKSVYCSGNDDSRVAIDLLTHMPLPISVYIEECDAYVKVIKIVKAINSKDGEHTRSVNYYNNANTTKAILNTPLLMIGAGGIGCELLKVLILYGFCQIHIIDLDTIDATNLNRQFLFTHEDIGESKAKMARRAVLKWFTCTREHSVHCESTESVGQLPDIIAHHAQVQAPEFDEAFFAQFGCVLSALDNVKARQHVNRMCAKVHIPLIESGTMGYNGQVQPILYGKYECYDCRPKPPDTQTFAVCTIHARPTTMVHCVHFAKELYNTLFASVNNKNNKNDDEEQNDTSKEWEQHDGNVENITNEVDNNIQTDKEASGNELSYLCKILETCLSAEPDKSNEASFEFSHQLARTLFHDKIQELLHMKSDWPTQAPTPIDLAILNSVYTEISSTDAHERFDNTSSCTHRNSVLCVYDEMKRFMQSTLACALRLYTCRCNRQRSQSMQFSKSDELAVAFVAAVSNLRAVNFHILPQSLESIRTVAGAIVPAIATTNAMVAAGVVRELLLVLSESVSATHTNTNTHKEQTKLLPMPREEQYETNDSEIASCDDTNIVCTDKEHIVPEMLYIRKFAQTRRRNVCIQNPFSICYSATDIIKHNASMLNKEVTSLAHLPKQKSHVSGNYYYHDHYLLHTAPLPLPNAQCQVCQRLLPRVEVTLLHPVECKYKYATEELMPLEEWTVEMFVEHILHNALGMDGVSITCNERIIFEEEEYEALSAHTLLSFATKINKSTSMEETRESKRAKVDSNGYTNDVNDDTITTDNLPYLTFLIDALNKQVGWEVIVKQNSQCCTDIHESFIITNMEYAEKIEAAEVKRLQEKQQEEQEEPEKREVKKQHNNVNSNHNNTDVRSGQLTDNANVIEIVSDDEDIECHDSTTIAQKNNDDNDDEVMIID